MGLKDRMNESHPKLYDFMMEKKKEYMPLPVQTDDVLLPAGLLDLTEAMARNVHEVWSAGRVADGWRYGDVRDDARKLHPCLVAYDDLPESEKEYDRNTALSTLKLIYKLGFEVVKK